MKSLAQSLTTTWWSFLTQTLPSSNTPTTTSHPHSLKTANCSWNQTGLVFLLNLFLIIYILIPIFLHTVYSECFPVSTPAFNLLFWFYSFHSSSPQRWRGWYKCLHHCQVPAALPSLHLPTGRREEIRDLPEPSPTKERLLQDICASLCGHNSTAPLHILALLSRPLSWHVLRWGKSLDPYRKVYVLNFINRGLKQIN